MWNLGTESETWPAKIIVWCALSRTVGLRITHSCGKPSCCPLFFPKMINTLYMHTFHDDGGVVALDFAYDDVVVSVIVMFLQLLRISWCSCFRCYYYCCCPSFSSVKVIRGKEILLLKPFTAFSYVAWFWSWERETVSVRACVFVCLCLIIMHQLCVSLKTSLSLSSHLSLYLCRFVFPSPHLSLLSVCLLSFSLFLMCMHEYMCLTVKYFFFPYVRVYVTLLVSIDYHTWNHFIVAP